MLLNPAIPSTGLGACTLSGSYFWGGIALLALAVAAVLIRVFASRRGL